MCYQVFGLYKNGINFDFEFFFSENEKPKRTKPIGASSIWFGCLELNKPIG